MLHKVACVRWYTTSNHAAQLGWTIWNVHALAQPQLCCFLVTCGKKIKRIQKLFTKITSKN